MEEQTYISLNEAAKYCNYSQEYLSLRARQGKLKAIKFGRNWVTKKEWLKEYLGHAEEYNHNGNHNNFSVPPNNLPIEAVANDECPTFQPVSMSDPVVKFSAIGIRFGFITALVFVFLISGIFLGRNDFKIAYQSISPLVAGFNENFDKGMVNLNLKTSPFVASVGGLGDIIVEDTIKVVSDTFTDIPQSFQYVRGEIDPQLSTAALKGVGIELLNAKILEGYFGNTNCQASGIGQKIVRGYIAVNSLLERKIGQFGKWAVSNYSQANDSLERSLTWGYEAFTQFWQGSGEFVGEELSPKSVNKGMVVIPFTEEEEVKEKIENSFSDEVKVEPIDETSGVIIPVFKKATEQKYLYILVPLKN